MTSVQFIYWLQGFFELADPENLTKNQVEIIQRHMSLVFKYEIDPSYSNDPKVQQELQDIHDGVPPGEVILGPGPNGFPSTSWPPTEKDEDGNEIKYRC